MFAHPAREKGRRALSAHGERERTAAHHSREDEIAAGRAILGLGAGVSGFAEMQIVRRRPVQAMRETVAIVQGLLRGETVPVQGEVITGGPRRLDVQPVRSRVLSIWPVTAPWDWL